MIVTQTVNWKSIAGNWKMICNVGHRALFCDSCNCLFCCSEEVQSYRNCGALVAYLLLYCSFNVLWFNSARIKIDRKYNT